jgi:predicted kinase
LSGIVIMFDKFRTQDERKHFKRVCSTSIKSLYILIGIPGAGKSYYAQKYLRDKDTIIVSADEIREMVYGSYKFSESTNKDIMKIAKQKIEEGLLCNINVVFDATNTNKNNRKQIVRIGKKYNVQIIAIVFKTSVSECIKRNELRSLERRVPKNKILMMASFDSNINKLEEGFDDIIYK